MPRKPRVIVSGGMYHVYCRFARGQRVFAEEAQCRSFLELVREACQRDEVVLLAWCLMPTHYHLVVRAGEIALSRTMRSVQGRFAQRYNRHKRVFGPLWQSRYKARLVDDAAFFQSVIAYVHLNPVVAKLVAEPGDYPWTSHHELLGKVREPIASVDETLRLFGETRRAARAAYRTLLGELGEQPWSKRVPGALPWWSRGGADETPLPARAKGPRLDPSGASSAPARPSLSAEELVAAASRCLGVESTLLSSPRRAESIHEARLLLAAVAVERYRLRVIDLARALERPVETVSRWVTGGAARRATDEDFASRYASLDQALRTERSTGRRRAKGKRSG
jgi:putative transposase